MAPALGNKWVFPQLRSMIVQSSTRKQDESEKENTDTEAASVFCTPSRTESNVPWRVELQLRRTTCVFVEHLAQLLGMPNAPSVTAQLYIQKFYMLHSFATHDRFVVATAALFLAGKTEEFPVKVRYVTECSMYLLLCPGQALEKMQANRATYKFKKGTTAASARRTPPPPASMLPYNKKQKRDSKNKSGAVVSSTFVNDKDTANANHLEWLQALLEVVEVGEIEANASKVLLLERILLLTLSFEIGAPQPFAYIAPHMEKVFDLDAMHPDISYENVRQIAFLLVADAVKSGLCLAFDCSSLAAGAVYVACLYHRQVGPNVATETNDPWWTTLNLLEQELEDVARCYLWMYEDENGERARGIGPGFLDLWKRYRPKDNLPDLEYIKALDAGLQTP
ncbi:unnamed protein product [Hyaloperonospora brassicae]|uniref:Cyclin N-terminal domain-containing protein n=1 Tax=Hyaloperonospora brassicae TaxID=162125 RepID=A0AAV0TCN3_HYABA|nr:unnamed protein product [Hyaloperonospora brassicae]